MEAPTAAQLRKLRGVAGYQFGQEVSKALFGRSTKIVCSFRTGRIRHIYWKDQLIATLRPKDGYLALTVSGAQLILSIVKEVPNLVVGVDDIAEYIEAGGDLFAKHVVRADEKLRPAEEAIVISQSGKLLGVGRAVLSGVDMKSFKRGVAVKIRKGVEESRGSSESKEA